MSEAATKANTKGAKFKTQMQEIQEAYDRKKRYGWLNRMFSSVGGFIFGMLWIILILSAVGAGCRQVVLVAAGLDARWRGSLRLRRPA